MLYSFLKLLSRLAIPIYCRKIIINKPGVLKETGPLLLAANHPNSFLDSVIIDTIFRHNVWSLARGDAFGNTFYSRLLRKLRIMPIYRSSEGKENLPENYKTFDNCLQVFRKNGIVMIFSEAKCINEWKLRPLRKGTARLAGKTWEAGIPLRVVPLGINYSSFKKFGKNVFLNFGEPITIDQVDLKQNDGLFNQAFNIHLEKQLRQLVIEMEKNDIAERKKKLSVRISWLERTILFIPALAGALVNAPLYLPLKAFTKSRTWNTDHYDSVLISLLMITYPFYLILVSFLVYFFTGSWLAWLLFLVIPFTAWAYVKLKRQIESDPE